ncbi:MAG: hypothetical protein ACKPKO_24835 [Candidatus Fonsibacter sp.]
MILIQNKQIMMVGLYFQLQIGSSLYPGYHIRNHGEAYYNL